MTNLPCPFCGSKPKWLEQPSLRSAEGETPLRAFGCDELACAIKPKTSWRATQEWEKGLGYFAVNHDDKAMDEWNTRRGIKDVRRK